LVVIDGDNVALSYGYVSALCGVGNQRKNRIPGSGRVTAVWLQGMKVAELCYAYYYNPNDGKKPTIGSVLDGC
jgi:MSHA pilin protein MshA